MTRLNKERELNLSPKRWKYAVDKIRSIGYEITEHPEDKYISFMFKGSEVRFFPYSGWATGKSIRDGRGLKGLVNQII